MLLDEERRLRRALGRALVASMGAALACSSGGDDAGAPRADASIESADATDSNTPPVDAAGSDARDVGAVVPPDADEIDAYVVWCDAGAPRIVDAGLLDDGACDYVVDSTCGLPAAWRSDGYGTLDGVTCIEMCPRGTNLITSCEVFYGQDTLPDSAAAPADAGFDATSLEGGALLVECNLCGGGGRRPEGYRDAKHVVSRSRIGAYFAELARLEAASVGAFLRLERELRAHRAPRELVAAARRAARDEVRHARVTARIARRWGGSPVIAPIASPGVRALEHLARENAIEGCVRETYGALVATWQGARASDAMIAGTMARIAADETRHAALAWCVAAWADRQLGHLARARVRSERRRAMEALDQSQVAAPQHDLVRIAGVPSGHDAVRLVASMRAALCA